MPSYGVFGAYGVDATLSMGPGGANINAEDVLDLMIDVTPWETPVVTVLPKTIASSTRHEWIEDSLVPALSAHDVLEGDDFAASADPNVGPVRMANFLQHFRYEVKVTNLQRMMNPYGVNDFYAYKVGQAAKQIGKDLEQRILEDTIITGTAYARQAVETNGGAGARARMSPLSELIAREGGALLTTQTAGGAKTLTNVTDTAFTGVVLAIVAGANGATWDATTPAFAAQAVLTENMVNIALQSAHGSGDSGGGHPDTMITFPAAFNVVGTFGKTAGAYGALTQNIDVSLRKIIRAVKFYDSQFGLIEVINSRWCPRAINPPGGAATTFVRGTQPTPPTTISAARNDGFVYFIERNRLRLAFGRTFRHVPLPPVGDSTRGMVLGDVTLELLGWKTAWLLAGVNSLLA